MDLKKIQYLDFNNHSWWSLWQTVPYDGYEFEYVKDISLFTPAFVINYNRNRYLVYTFLEYADQPEYL